MQKRLTQVLDAVWGVTDSPVVCKALEDPSPVPLPPTYFFNSSHSCLPLRSTMLGRNVSLTGETKIMFMGSSSTEIIFHISAIAWALWGSKSDFLLPVPMGNIMGKKTDWIVREMAWHSCGRLVLCSCAKGQERRGGKAESKMKIWMFSDLCRWESEMDEPHYGNHNFMPQEERANQRPWNTLVTMGQLTSTHTELWTDNKWFSLKRVWPCWRQRTKCCKLLTKYHPVYWPILKTHLDFMWTKTQNRNCLVGSREWI